ncbi:MAG: hypothetical protein HYX92_16850 [Chloroflexi bacterium]|nr:hypothetical protein [Chloroflexota bacterium]
MGEPTYEVLWPLGKSVSRTAPPADRTQGLAGRTVCELWDQVFRGDEVFALLREILPTKYPGIKFVDYKKFGNTNGPGQRELIGALPQMLKEYGCDAVISGVGA